MIIGVDPSLSNTGLAMVSDPVHGLIRCRTIQSPLPPQKTLDPDLTELWRMNTIRDTVAAWVPEVCSGFTPDLAVIEAPAFSRVAGKTHERSGLWWKIFEVFAEMKVPVLTVKPNLRAKYATGNGKSGKDEVMLAAAKRYPHAEIANNNEADAVLLAAMGARLRGAAIDSVPKTHTDALKTLTLPKWR